MALRICGLAFVGLLFSLPDDGFAQAVANPIVSRPSDPAAVETAMAITRRRLAELEREQKRLDPSDICGGPPPSVKLQHAIDANRAHIEAQKQLLLSQESDSALVKSKR